MDKLKLEELVQIKDRSMGWVWVPKNMIFKVPPVAIPSDRERAYVKWLDKRIKEAGDIGLPEEYTFALQDAKKVFISDNPYFDADPLMRLVV